MLTETEEEEEKEIEVHNDLKMKKYDSYFSECEECEYEVIEESYEKIEIDSQSTESSEEEKQ